MADSGWQDVKDMANWAYNRATSRPIGRIETTLRTGKPAPAGGGSLSDATSAATDYYNRAKKYVKSRISSPASMTYGPVAPKKRAKSPSKGRR